MDRKDWLSSLEPGSSVLVTNTWLSPKIEKVSRVTKTMIVVGHSRFNRESGSEVGSINRWHSSSIQPVTEAHLDAQKRATLRSVISEKLNGASSEVLEQVNALLSEKRS